tara:strand:- start:3538 stop:4257 length:720 start_codon:yes stop_codon:yes gene_type:complete
MDNIKKKIGIHQPNFLPWIGYFAKLLASDEFIFLDTAQFSKGSYQNRVLIKNPQESKWFTANVQKEKDSFMQSKFIKLSNFDFWKEKHLKTLQANYSKSNNFNFFFEKIENFYRNSDFKYLCEFNIGLIIVICEALEIPTNKFIRSSELDITSTGDDALIDIAIKRNADVYLSGSGGKKYQDEKKFEDKGISIEYNFFTHPQYNQLWGEFIEGLSIVDLLLNEGENASTILKESVLIND